MKNEKVFSKGMKVKILAIHPYDGYYSIYRRIIGRVGIISSDYDVDNWDDGWTSCRIIFKNPIRRSDNYGNCIDELVFYKVRLKKVK